MKRAIVTACCVLSVNAAVAQGQVRTAAESSPALAERSSGCVVSLDAKTVTETLKDMAESLKRLNRASGELHSEVNRRETIVIGPDVMDQEIMDPWMSAYPGLSPNGFAAGFQNTRPGPLLPARKRYVDMSMSEITQLVQALDGDMSIFNSAVEHGIVSDSFKAQFLTLKDVYARVDKAASRLLPLTQVEPGSPYDNRAISAASEDIHDEVNVINELRRRMLKQVNK